MVWPLPRPWSWIWSPRLRAQGLGVDPCLLKKGPAETSKNVKNLSKGFLQSEVLGEVSVSDGGSLGRSLRQSFSRSFRACFAGTFRAKKTSAKTSALNSHGSAQKNWIIFREKLHDEVLQGDPRQKIVKKRQNQRVINGVFQTVFFRVVCSEGGPEDPQVQKAPKCLKTRVFSGSLCPSEKAYLCRKLRSRIWKTPFGKHRLEPLGKKCQEYFPRICKPWFPHRGSRLPAEQSLNWGKIWVKKRLNWGKIEVKRGLNEVKLR